MVLMSRFVLAVLGPTTGVVRHAVDHGDYGLPQMVNAYVPSAWSKERLPVQNAESLRLPVAVIVVPSVIGVRFMSSDSGSILMLWALLFSRIIRLLPVGFWGVAERIKPLDTWIGI